MNIGGLDRAAVLAALYNAARPQGLGFLHYDPNPMGVEEARRLLNKSSWFDYVKGRVLKIGLAAGDEVDTRLYNRDNGAEAAEKAIDALRSSGDSNAPVVRDAHAAGMIEAAGKARAQMNEPPSERKEIDLGFGRIPAVELGLRDVKDRLGPAVDRAMGDGTEKTE